MNRDFNIFMCPHLWVHYIHYNDSINISETKVKHYINNKVLFSYQQMKQNNKRSEEDEYGKVKISKGESKDC